MGLPCPWIHCYWPTDWKVWRLRLRCRPLVPCHGKTTHQYQQSGGASAYHMIHAYHATFRNWLLFTCRPISHSLSTRPAYSSRLLAFTRNKPLKFKAIQSGRFKDTSVLFLLREWESLLKNENGLRPLSAWLIVGSFSTTLLPILCNGFRFVGSFGRGFWPSLRWVPLCQHSIAYKSMLDLSFALGTVEPLRTNVLCRFSWPSGLGTVLSTSNYQSSSTHCWVRVRRNTCQTCWPHCMWVFRRQLLLCWSSLNYLLQRFGDWYFASSLWLIVNFIRPTQKCGRFCWCKYLLLADSCFVLP